MLRVDKNVYDQWVKERLSSIPEGSKLYKKIMKEVSKGKMGRFFISKDFNKQFYDILKPNTPDYIPDIDYSIIHMGSDFDTGPFIKLGDVKK